MTFHRPKENTANRLKLSYFLLAILIAAVLNSCAATQWGYYRTGAGIKNPAFEKLLATTTDDGFIGGNDIKILVNGDEIFLAMLADINEAADSIHMETYIFNSDEIGHRFAEAMRAKARSGVSVKLIVDDFGDGMAETFKRELREAGVQLLIDNPFSWLAPTGGNIRTHRKLLVVDGRIAYTGGIGIDDRWLGDAQDANHWRETQCRVLGPAAAQFQTMFLESWARAGGGEISEKNLYPAIDPAGDKLAAAVGHADPENWSKVRKMLLLALAASRDYYWVSSGYFNPDIDLMKALIEAKDRGVDVRVIVAGDDIDLYSSRLLASKNYGRLIKAGVRIYEYQGTNMHAKTVVADDLFVSVGSTNFCNRAFNYNYESNLVTYDDEIAEEMHRIYLMDIKHSVEVNTYEWDRRPLHQRILEQAIGVVEGWM